ncbi:MAG: universal stress protein [Thermorudis peleae]|nr:universal stress protein [Thermorudis peleae]
MNELPASNRPDPDALLAQLRREPGSGARGFHRIYLGMAPGVGKTYAALQELHRLREQGIDVAIAFVETYGRPKTAALLEGLPIIPRKRCQYRGVIVEEMDLDAVLLRQPAVVLVDELAHTNVPDCTRHAKRWQDVEELLEHGISVLSTLNIQHIESLADIVESITGVVIRERVPDDVVDKADEVVLVDVTPQVLRQRLREGEVYPPERAQLALRQFFREGNLTALRELALRKLASRVEHDLQTYMHQHDVDTVWPAGERVMVAVDAHPRAQHLIRRGWRRAQRSQSDLLVVFVETPDWAHAPPEVKRQLEENLRFAEDLGAEVLRIPGEDVAKTLVDVARERNVDSIIIGHSRHGWLHRLLHGSTVEKLLRLAHDIDILVVAPREPSANVDVRSQS